MEVKDAVDVNKLQDNIFSACAWSKTWEISFNPKKCKILHIGSGESSEYFIKDNNDTLSKIHNVDYEKDLGVIFDTKLNFSKHISTKVKLANRNLGIISKTFTFMDPEMFLTLYKSLVRPHLEYASVIWSPKFKKDKIVIENVQRRATRLVQSLKTLAYKERLIKLGLPTLEYRRERADLIQTFKLLNNIDKTSKEIITRRDAAGTRGNCLKLYKKRFNHDVKKHSFSNRVVNLWNSLTDDIVTAPSLNSFKSRLNKLWKPMNKFNAHCYN